MLLLYVSSVGMLFSLMQIRLRNANAGRELSFQRTFVKRTIALTNALIFKLFFFVERILTKITNIKLFRRSNIFDVFDNFLR